MTRDQIADDLWWYIDAEVCSSGGEVAGISDAVCAILAHPRIARALTLLDTIGDEAADALIAGTATDRDVQLVKDGIAAIAAGRLDRGGA